MNLQIKKQCPGKEPGPMRNTGENVSLVDNIKKYSERFKPIDANLPAASTMLRRAMEHPESIIVVLDHQGFYAIPKMLSMPRPTVFEYSGNEFASEVVRLMGISIEEVFTNSGILEDPLQAVAQHLFRERAGRAQG